MAREVVEGNVCFPSDSLERRFFRPGARRTTCPWKGVAQYYTLVVDGAGNADAAWYYRDPRPAARNIRDHVAFRNGVEVAL